MRLPDAAHTSLPWRIHELTRDFRLEDVWALPTPGGPHDFHRLVERFASVDPSESSSALVRALFALRWKLGQLLRWDSPGAAIGARVPTLHDRLPADLRAAPRGPEFDSVPFASIYLLEHEWAAESANETMHGSFTWDGCRMAAVVIAVRWPSWSSRMACSGTRTWRRSGRSGT